MTLAERLQEILGKLPSRWTEARLIVTIADPGQADRAASILGSLSPGRTGASFVVTMARGGVGGPSPEATRRVLERLERDGIDARLSAPASEAPAAGDDDAAPKTAPLAARWDELAAALPGDWSDLYLEVELGSSAETDRAALLLGPVNPFLHDSAPARFRFRAARRFGYGAAPQMTRRALARLDEESIRGNLRVLRVQSETSPVLTQGPVWRERGRSV
jgi:hypothetical protein